MKILSFDRNSSGTLTMPPSLDVIPDSALVTGSNPMFLADFSRDWIGQLYLAFRISRLGKAIAAKFAPRYYDAVTLAVRAIPSDMIAELRELGLSDGLCAALDSTVAIGQWQPLPAPGASYPVSCGDFINADLQPEHIGIDQAISCVSRYATLKTGDVVMPCHLSVGFPLRPDMLVEAKLNGQTAVRLKIK